MAAKKPSPKRPYYKGHRRRRSRQKTGPAEADASGVLPRAANGRARPPMVFDGVLVPLPRREASTSAIALSRAPSALFTQERPPSRSPSAQTTPTRHAQEPASVEVVQAETKAASPTSANPAPSVVKQDLEEPTQSADVPGRASVKRDIQPKKEEFEGKVKLEL